LPEQRVRLCSVTPFARKVKVEGSSRSLTLDSWDNLLAYRGILGIRTDFGMTDADLLSK